MKATLEFNLPDDLDMAGEAKVERLRELLNRAIKIAEKLEKEGLSASQLIDLHYEIDAVKELAIRI